MDPLRRWATRLAILSIEIIGRAPAILRYIIGYMLGTLAYILSRRHRHIGRTNLSLCFPAMDKRSRELLLYKNFCHLSIGVCETAFAWCGNIRKILSTVEWEGLDKFKKIFNRQQPIILISGHFSYLDPGLIIFAHRFPLVATYKMHANHLFNDFMRRKRLLYVRQLLASEQTFGIKDAFRRHRILWFSVDQDIGRKYSLYIPFFATQAACHTVAWRWSRMIRAEVFLLHCIRKKNLSYRINLLHLKRFMTLPAQEALQLQNRALNQSIQQAPAQYLWLHKRFKTQADRKNVYAPMQ